jgi:hypothetical protein
MQNRDRHNMFFFKKSQQILVMNDSVGRPIGFGPHSKPIKVTKALGWGY